MSVPKILAIPEFPSLIGPNIADIVIDDVLSEWRAMNEPTIFLEVIPWRESDLRTHDFNSETQLWGAMMLLTMEDFVPPMYDLAFMLKKCGAEIYAGDQRLDPHIPERPFDGPRRRRTILNFIDLKRPELAVLYYGTAEHIQRSSPWLGSDTTYLRR